MHFTYCLSIPGFDPELLAMIPQPVEAMIFLFPITDIYNKYKDEEEAHLVKHEQSISPDVIFFKQTIENACGMIALLHSVSNNDDEIVGPGVLNDFIEEARNMSPDERAELIENSKELEAIHEAAARDGQTAAPNLEDDVDMHFICFVEVDQHIYELDGRKMFPINHGKSTNLVEVFSLYIHVLGTSAHCFLYFYTELGKGNKAIHGKRPRPKALQCNCLL